MKRIVIAVMLMLVIIGLNFLSERMITTYCNNIKVKLDTAIECLENSNHKKAEKYITEIKNDKTLVPYIYNLDFKKIKKELDDAKNLIKLKEDEYAKICIMRSISILDDIYEEYSFLHHSKVK